MIYSARPKKLTRHTAHTGSMLLWSVNDNEADLAFSTTETVVVQAFFSIFDVSKEIHLIISMR